MSTQILAVIHSKTSEQATENALLAINCGCDGVFFISHGALFRRELYNIACDFRSEYGERCKVGINLLSDDVLSSMRLANKTLDYVWSDYTPIAHERKRFLQVREDEDLSPVFFGGVAFKYQPQPADLTHAAKDAIGVVDILTTSGSATGVVPEIEKLAKLAEGFGNKIAVASGVTSDNATEMLPYVSHFLVATGISKDFYTIDENRCKALVNAIRSSE